MYLLLYVDDILIVGGSSSDIERLKNLLKGEFEMKDLGNVKRILGMHIHKDRVTGTLFVSQKRYVNKVLKKFEMLNSKPALTPLGAQFKLFGEMSLKS